MTGIAAPAPFLLVGCGNMAGAMLRRWLDVGLDPASVTVIRLSGQPVAPGIRVLKAVPESGPPPALVLLGVKPQKIDEVAPDLAGALGDATILVSILAGVEHRSLRDRFPAARTIVRAMPNTPVALGKGVTGLYAAGGTAADRAAVERLMAALGLVEWTDDEATFDLLGTLTGCGPAFVFRFVDALAAAGAALGLEAAQAARLATATVEGAGLLTAGSGETPSRLADRVASPGGSTREGLNVLDADEALATLVRRTLEASFRRGREMAEAARRG
jgi:pyrroline-5-carboxylate reductase